MTEGVQVSRRTSSSSGGILLGTYPMESGSSLKLLGIEPKTSILKMIEF